MVTFYFSQLKVSNFRGIKDLVLDLSPDAPTVLIGPNNAGKSTVLDAMGICLSSAKFSKYIIDDRDFWTDGAGTVSEDFEIVLTFSPRGGGSLPAVKGGIGDPVYVHGIRAVGNRGEPSTTKYLIDDKGENILLTVSVPVSKAKKDEFKGMGLGGRRFAKPMDIGKWMPLVFQLDAQNLFTSLYSWQSGPLNRLMKMYREHLTTDEWIIDDKRQMPEYIGRLYKYLNDVVLQTPFWRDTLADELSAKLKEYLGRSPGFAMRPQLNDLEDWLASELMFRVSPGTGLAGVDSKRLGDGWQSLIRLAALEVVMKLEDSQVVLLMEEPETFLHPHLRRRMRRVFSELQTKGSQSVITTHSSELISFNLNQDIVRLRMSTDGVVGKRYSTTSASQAMKDEEKLHEHGNHEVVFANAAVISEGKDDECAIRMALEKQPLDCDAESISIVACGGVGNLPDYAQLCSTLGIPWIAVHDLDIDPATGVQKPKTTAAAAALAALASQADKILTWDNTLEDCVNCPQAKASPEWLLQTYGASTWPQLKANGSLAKYCSTVESIVAALH